MVLEFVVQKFPYVLKGVPVYETLKATECSHKRLNHRTAVESALEQGVPLQGLGDVFVIRYAFDQRHAKEGTDIDNSNKCQVLSTVELCLRDNMGWWNSHFVELPNDERSVALVREGYAATNDDDNEDCFLKPRSDAFIDELVRTAVREKRVAPALQETALQENELYLSVAAKKSGSSEYGKNEFMVAATGHSELAELNASYLRAKGCEQGIVADLTEEVLEANCPKGMVICRPLSLGGNDHFYHFDCVYADDSFIGGGWARWVVHAAQKSSSGNKSRQKVRSR